MGRTGPAQGGIDVSVPALAARLLANSLRRPRHELPLHARRPMRRNSAIHRLSPTTMTSPFRYFEPQLISLRDSAGLDERWVQERLAENPKLLGLGDLVLKDKERLQPGAGRLDLLLQDPETARRYELELQLQLGRTDERHIIRTIEYWDIERKRYPQYDHCAVIVAEEITGRFLNVISLFNGFVPLIALRMQAVLVDGSVGLIFTKVLVSRPRNSLGKSF